MSLKLITPRLVKRYLADFIQVATLYKQNFSQQQIRLIAQKSDRLVREYIQLYDIYYKLDNKRLLELISPEPVSEDAKKKSRIPSSKGGR